MFCSILKQTFVQQWQKFPVAFLTSIGWKNVVRKNKVLRYGKNSVSYCNVPGTKLRYGMFLEYRAENNSARYRSNPTLDFYFRLSYCNPINAYAVVVGDSRKSSNGARLKKLPDLAKCWGYSLVLSPLTML